MAEMGKGGAFQDLARDTESVHYFEKTGERKKILQCPSFINANGNGANFLICREWNRAFRPFPPPYNSS